MRCAPCVTRCSRSTAPSVSARAPARRFSSASQPKDYSAQRTRGFGLSVFSEFTPLAVQHKAVNLGQGFPDFHAPDFVIKAAQKAIGDHINQYTRSAGHLRLVNALAKHFSPLFGRSLDPLTEITTTVGATEGIFATMQAVVNPGEEAIVIEPFYDSYPPSIEMAGGITKYVSLRPSPRGTTSSADWKLDLNELEKAISKKTKLIVVNNPSNIPGKVFSKEELQGVGNLAKKHDLLVLSDEVYEAMVYAPSVHTRIATLPGMWDRTITLGSAGKSFSVTGHKVGWVVGPRPLEAIAVAFEEAPRRNYWSELTASYTAKRSALLDALNSSKLLTPVASQGSYFVLADFSRVPESLYVKAENQNGRTDAIDYQFCRWLTKEVGVAAIPLSPFYSNISRLPGKYARFTFCKRDEVIADGAARLKKLASMKI